MPLTNPGEKPLYFDYQASTPVDPAVVTAMMPFFSEQFGNPHSAEHLFGHRALEAIELARSQVAALIGAEPQDIIFTSGATEANNLAILGIARNEDLARRDTILVSAIEHSSVLEAALHSGLRVVSVGVTPEGLIDQDFFQAHLSERVRLVSFGAVNNEIGAQQDIEVLGQAAREVGALVHVDAAQAVSALELDAAAMPVDFMSLSSHKAYGPKGVGALYAAPGRRRLLTPLMFGGGQESGMRAGTLPTPLCVGFGVACALIRSSGKEERVRIKELRDYFFAQLQSVCSEASLIGPSSARHPGNLSIKLPVADARDVLQLAQTGLACSTGSACHSGSELPSHVLLALGMPVAEARRILRLGIGRFTTVTECDRAVAILMAAIAGCTI